MAAYEVVREKWTYHLAPQLTSRAQQAFAALPVGESKSYDSVKAAILARYNINEEEYKVEETGKPIVSLPYA
jgi:hypothetical protein